MKLSAMIRSWLTRELYNEPDQKVDKWLEERYVELIQNLENKYPNTVCGVTDELFDRVAIVKAYKKKFYRYNQQNLMERFDKFWISCMERDSRLKAVWNINPSYWDENSKYHYLLNQCQSVIWCDTSVSLTEEFIKKYFERYVSEVFSRKFFSKLTLNFENILEESYQVNNEERIDVKNDSHLMAIKCFANLTYEEVFKYLKNALVEEGNFEVEYVVEQRGYAANNNSKDYKGFPSGSARIGTFDENNIFIIVKYNLQSVS